MPLNFPGSVTVLWFESIYFLAGGGATLFLPAFFLRLDMAPPDKTERGYKQNHESNLIKDHQPWLEHANHTQDNTSNKHRFYDAVHALRDVIVEHTG